jgi:hypothetical protein
VEGPASYFCPVSRLPVDVTAVRVCPGGPFQRRGGQDGSGDVVAEVILTLFQRYQAAADNVVASAFSGTAGRRRIYQGKLRVSPALERLLLHRRVARATVSGISAAAS